MRHVAILAVRTRSTRLISVALIAEKDSVILTEAKRSNVNRVLIDHK